MNDFLRRLMEIMNQLGQPQPVQSGSASPTNPAMPVGQQMPPMQQQPMARGGPAGQMVHPGMVNIGIPTGGAITPGRPQIPPQLTDVGVPSGGTITPGQVGVGEAHNPMPHAEPDADDMTMAPLDIVRHPDGRVTMSIPHQLAKHIMKSKPKK